MSLALTQPRAKGMGPSSVTAAKSESPCSQAAQGKLASTIGCAAALGVMRSTDLGQPYCRFLSFEAAAGAGVGVAAGVAGGGAVALAGPNSRRVGFRSRLITARLISPRVRRPSAI